MVRLGAPIQGGSEEDRPTRAEVVPPRVKTAEEEAQEKKMAVERQISIPAASTITDEAQAAPSPPSLPPGRSLLPPVRPPERSEDKEAKPKEPKLEDILERLDGLEKETGYPGNLSAGEPENRN
jgi:hypothetical protein